MMSHSEKTTSLIRARTPGGAVAAHIDRLNEQAETLRRPDVARALHLAHEALSLSSAQAYPEGQLRALLLLADCALDSADYAAAAAHAERAQALAHKHGARRALAAAGVRLGVTHTRNGDFSAALEQHETSLALFRNLGERLGEAEALMYTGGVYIDLSRYAEAQRYLTQALAIFADEGDLPGQAQARLMLGITAGVTGEMTSSFQHYTVALELAKAQNDPLTQVRVLNNLVGNYDLSGDSDKALECYLQALELSERLDYPQMRTSLLVNVANTYLNLGELDRAISYAAEALDLGYLRDKAEASETLGKLYLLKADPARAEGYFRGALEAAQAAGDLHAQATSLASLADLARQRGQFGVAEQLFRESVATAQLTDHALGEVGARLGLGKILAAQGEEAQARGELHQAVALAIRYDYKRQLLEAYRALSESFEREGQLGDALGFYKRYAEIGRLFSNERIAERTATLMGRLELERAEKNAELERLRNHELAAANAALRTTLAENTALLAQLRKQAVRLERQTREDALTGLHNRRHLEEQLALEFSSARRYDHALCAALVDIDDFKTVNDTLSHQIGDEVLRVVAKIFAAFVREVDLVARYGGEEFALVFPQTPLAGGIAVCERIREAVAGYAWAHIHPDLRVTLSIGVAADLSVKDHEKLLALADDNLYRAKRAGKNRVLA